MITERAIINFIMWICGLILGSYVATSAAGGDFTPLLITFAILFPLFTFFARERLCTFPLLGGYLAGKFRFIPSGLAAADICAFALILYFLVDYIVIRHKPVRIRPVCFFVPIMALFLIVLYHDHDLGLRAFGGAMEGSRSGVLILVACTAYLSGINVTTPSASFLRRLPWFGVMLAFLSAIPFTISTYVPSLTPYLYVVSDNVNMQSFAESGSYAQDSGIGRNGSLGGLGGTLMTCLLCYYPINTWWRPNRWYLIILGIISLGLTLSGGFRNGVVTLGFSVLLCIWSYLSWRALILIPTAFAALLILNFNQEYEVIPLPLTAQRSLSFLPAKWDPDVVAAAKISNDFRDNIKSVYYKEYLYKSPWFGNGISFDAAKFDQLSYLAATHDTRDHYYQAEVFITGKMFHTGWLSVYDIVGLVGGAAFVFLNLSMIWVSGRLVFRKGADRGSPMFPVKVWVFMNCTTNLFAFFTLFGDFKTAFPALCYTAIVLTHLDRFDRATRQKVSVPLPHQSIQLNNPRSSLYGEPSRG